MTELLLGEILRALAVPGLRYEAALGAVPPRPGLYAIYGSAEVWQQISLGDPPDDRPLYVGKAERSLLGRDLRTPLPNWMHRVINRSALPGRPAPR